MLTVAGLATQQDQYRPMHTSARERALPGAGAPHPVDMRATMRQARLKIKERKSGLKFRIKMSSRHRTLDFPHAKLLC